MRSLLIGLGLIAVLGGCANNKTCAEATADAWARCGEQAYKNSTFEVPACLEATDLQRVCPKAEEYGICAKTFGSDYPHCVELRENIFNLPNQQSQR